MPMEGDSEKKTKEVQAALEKVESVHSDVNKLEQQVSELRLSVVNGQQPDGKRFEVMGELLMIQLLKLDGIEVEGEARAQRKAEVKRVQGLVDNVDSLKLETSRALVPVPAPGPPKPQEQGWVPFSNGSPPPQTAVPFPPLQMPQEQPQLSPTSVPNGAYTHQSQSVSSTNPYIQTTPPPRSTSRSGTPGSANSTSSTARHPLPPNASPDPVVPYAYSGRAAASSPNRQSPPSARQSPSSARRVPSIASSIALDDDDFDPRGGGQNGGSSAEIVQPQSGNLHPKPSPDRLSGGTFAPSPLGSHSRQSSRSSSGVPLPSERLRPRDPSPRSASERRGFSGASPGRSRSVDPHGDSGKRQQSSVRQHQGEDDGRRATSRPSSRGGEEGRSSRRNASESRQQVELREEETGGRGSHMPWNISQRDYAQRRDNTPQRDSTPHRDHTPQREERDRDYERSQSSQWDKTQRRDITPQRSERGGREFISPGTSRAEREYTRRAGGGEGQRVSARHTSPLPRSSHDRSYVAERQGAYAGYGDQVNMNGSRNELELYGSRRGDEWDGNRGAKEDREHHNGRGDYGGGREPYSKGEREVYEKDTYGGGRSDREQYRGARYDDREPSRGRDREQRWEGGGYGTSSHVGYVSTPHRGPVQEYGSIRMQPPTDSMAPRSEMERYERGGSRQGTSNRPMSAYPPPANGDLMDAKWETFDVGATYPAPNSNASRMERNWTKF